MKFWGSRVANWGIFKNQSLGGLLNKKKPKKGGRRVRRIEPKDFVCAVEVSPGDRDVIGNVSREERFRGELVSIRRS